jgi:hypothetical protein
MQLEVIVSAPSRYVHRDLRRRLSEFWPDVKSKMNKSAHQVRGIQDCGLFMLLHFFAHYLQMKVCNER